MAQPRQVIDDKFSTLYANMLQGRQIDDAVLKHVRKQVLTKLKAAPRGGKGGLVELEDYFQNQEEIFKNVQGLFAQDPRKTAADFRHIMRKEQKNFDEAAYKITGASRN